jgi:hypothetical protein
MERASNLRMVALASVVALSAITPLAVATAGPPTGPLPPATSVADHVPVDAAASAVPQPDSGLLDALSALTSAGQQTASCGPQLASRGGALRAQTCTLTEDGDTWARTYYRNLTGRRLTGVLTLMRPDGRTVQVVCSIAVTHEPGECETPRQRTVSSPEFYAAVAEVAADGTSELLLRSGSYGTAAN